MRAKHRNDQKHGRNGMVGGNPRYSRSGVAVAVAAMPQNDGGIQLESYLDISGWREWVPVGSHSRASSASLLMQEATLLASGHTLRRV